MQSFEKRVESELSAGKIPGGIASAANNSGSFKYLKAFGPKSLKAGSEPLQTDAVLWLASCTKLLASISALQCVERGQFTLDEDVTELLPELKDIDILTGFEPDSDKPILVKATKTITLRQFLTHTSGLAYDIFNPELQRWRKGRGEVPGVGTLIERYKTPLLFEPGENWTYSTGLDWAGLMVERVNNMTLGAYIQKHVLAPLGVKEFTFHPEDDSEYQSRVPGMAVRLGGTDGFGTCLDPEGALEASEDKLWVSCRQDSGGAGGYATMSTYQAVLRSITIGDGKLLGSDMLDELYRPQLNPKQLATVHGAMTFESLRNMMAPGLPADSKVDYGLGGLIVTEDVEGKRRKGTMNWTGLPNLCWWSDRASGISGIYGSQLLPTADPKIVTTFSDFEKAVYEHIKAEA